MNKIIFDINCFLRKRRLINSIKKANRSMLNLKKAREERIWIENNPQIHILNYPYYKLKRIIEKVKNKIQILVIFFPLYIIFFLAFGGRLIKDYLPYWFINGLVLIVMGLVILQIIVLWGFFRWQMM